jgi:hypothetical protein
MNITEERFIFTPALKKQLGIIAVVGLVVAIIGIIAMVFFGHGDTHAVETEPSEHHGLHWSTRVWASIWINNVYFVGLSIIGVFFFALQYVAQAGWSAGLKRIPLAFGSWLPVGAILMIIVFVVANHDLFHWTHGYLYDQNDARFDGILYGKSGYLNFWFYIGRMVLYFALWIYFFYLLRREAFAEDINGGTIHYHKLVKYSAIFIIIFAITSSMSAWDWVLSIDPHWFSTMFGWYVFASWFVAGLAAITLVVVLLKDAGYLPIVNSNHLHDLGKFIFAFSIFWTYIWFSQFMLIYYANIPEETIYYIERLTSDHYTPIFFLNLFLNFLFPFLVLMTRDSKRHAIFLKIVCIVILIGHWFDFYLMITPGVMGEDGAFGFLEIGLAVIYAAAFAFTVLISLAKAPLVARNHPMLQESIHHHI